MSTSSVYRVKGMTCASCVSLIQNKVAKVPGVESVSVGLANEKAKVVFSGSPLSVETLNNVISPLGYTFEDTSKTAAEMNMSAEDHARMDHSGGMGERNMALEMKFVIPMVIFSFVMMFWDVLSGNGVIPAMPKTIYEFFHHLMPIFASFVLFGIGRRYIKATWIFLKTGVANMDVLVGISTIVAFIYSLAVTAFEAPLSRYLDVSSNYYDVVIIVIGLIALGQFLEARAKKKTNEALQKLAQLTSKFAVVERDGKEIEIPIEKVEVGDVVIVKPNEKIPVDGKVVFGSSSVDESNLTGESVPVDKLSGASVFAGTQNFQGLLKIEVQKEVKDTALAHIITIVDNAQNSKAPIERVADRISGYFVYIVLVIAVVTFASWMIFAPQAFGMSKAFALAIYTTMAVLVIACPCSLGLATPTAIITGVGTGARRGILIKSAESLEKLAKVTALVFDKTGTLTENKLSIEGIFCKDENHVCDVEDTNFKQSLIYSMTKSSKHPISASIASWLNDAKAKSVEVADIKEVPGKGLSATHNGTMYYLGSIAYIGEVTKQSEEQIRKDFHDGRFESGRELYLSNNKEVLSLVKIHDTVKAEAKAEIAKLKKLGLKVIMATGDHKKTGEAVGRDLGIDEVYTDVKPEDKLNLIKDLQKKGFKVAMIGDGVNDSPALAQADVAISMSDGSDIAIESSDIVLLKGDIGKVAEAVNLAKKTNRTIWQNLIWSFGYNSVGIPVAAGILFPFFGWTLSPAIAGAIMAFESVTVVANSLRLKNAKL
ncbi:copper-translocating P-type ATPase [Candidatus Adlerbacteria bacterium RIFOXYC1_FULL_48_26]|uniref:Copper-translocating P-type ATPase n=1 Tax=Candidatus Adlerbacteria bacterium RIFOXYC1_FULL_48_26 TaxID=1797247 RepID=A0A1F4Y2C4_9BACT|nr:MAG: copper-translocating P-type ATPase [Candidatus Adlerbacteria bacterium RIFOXYC1_FULL_48_26]OGC93950.1 MAG: copper-translocating P-type ATPase [Candidatus Adlerbacteria bacterium RIFOXYB1_FULL_48_10]OGC96052.1 MAG: copper-translocating P-type ATPase [Candidatus Adlerbacteria bacterium RIFOXYD1_FULL_48_8]